MERLEEFLREERLPWLGHVEGMDEERGPVRVQHLEVVGSKKKDNRKRDGKMCWNVAQLPEVCNEWLDVQDRDRLRVGCKNRLNPACREHLLLSTGLQEHKEDAHSWSKMMMKFERRTSCSRDKRITT